ncbi:hypothetical protein Y1Q_0018742 [Alligator mississippiensis]|uniref:Uncharacterized protein n=1 Tax=Alligator mississippiensis TaxID=8496 RepID=A0A151NTB4_ALLMI|nr:hypothetical protein Y1Q_0018742 [Alligator mississippiensis]
MAAVSSASSLPAGHAWELERKMATSPNNSFTDEKRDSAKDQADEHFRLVQARLHLPPGRKEHKPWVSAPVVCSMKRGFLKHTDQKGGKHFPISCAGLAG